MTTSTLKSNAPETLAVAFERAAVTFKTLAENALETLYVWQKRSTDRRTLRQLQLNDHLLSDVGLNRGAIQEEATKPFWRV